MQENRKERTNEGGEEEGKEGRTAFDQCSCLPFTHLYLVGERIKRNAFCVRRTCDICHQGNEATTKHIRISYAERRRIRGEMRNCRN